MAIGMGASVAAKAGSLIATGGKNAGRYIINNPGKMMVGLDAVGGLNQNLKQGRSFGASALRVGVDIAAYSVFGGAYTAAQVGYGAYQAAGAAVDYRKRKGQELAVKSEGGRIGGNFMDTDQAQTMRQAATQQIQANKMNARSALGGEARIFSGGYNGR